jgi:hypothetical protein
MSKAQLKELKASTIISSLEDEEGGHATSVRISAPNLMTAVFDLTSDAPYMQARFSAKAATKIRVSQEAGSPQGKKTRTKRDFEDDCLSAQYISTEGWHGIPAGAFRTAMIDCCRLVNYKMTFAKLSVFVEADGFDKIDGTPLVRLMPPNGNKTFEPETNIGGVRNANGSLDLRARPMWRHWKAALRVRYDADQFTLDDVSNLLARVGKQCGIGEGRPNSRKSTGIGFGLFSLKHQKHSALRAV